MRMALWEYTGSNRGPWRHKQTIIEELILEMNRQKAEIALLKSIELFSSKHLFKQIREQLASNGDT